MNKEREQLKKEYPELYSEIESILFKYDLMDINFGFNSDEYAPEVDTILPRLNKANEIEDVVTIIYEEFVRWFDEGIVKNKNNPAYMAMASEVWEAFNKYCT